MCYSIILVILLIVPMVCILRFTPVLFSCKNGCRIRTRCQLYGHIYLRLICTIIYVHTQHICLMCDQLPLPYGAFLMLVVFPSPVGIGITHLTPTPPTVGNGFQSHGRRSPVSKSLHEVCLLHGGL